jgi:hypothetical protein
MRVLHWPVRLGSFLVVVQRVNRGAGARKVFAVVLAFVAFCGAARPGVIVVDPLGGNGVALLESALTAASDGDILLLRAGTYYHPTSGIPKSYVVDGKGLSIVADAGVAPLHTYGFTIEHLPAGSAVLLRGLIMDKVASSKAFSPPPRLRIDGHQAGHVWVEDCTILGAVGATVGSLEFITAPGCDAVRVEARATFVRCTLVGGRGANDEDFGFFVSGAQRGGDGATITGDGAASFIDCTLRGGAGGDGEPEVPSFGGASGGAGGHVSGKGFASFFRCSLEGGDEGKFNDAEPQAAGDGIAATTSTPSVVWMRDSEAVPGDVQGLGTPGVAVNAAGGAVTTFPAGARLLVTSPVVYEGGVLQATVAGAQGDLVGVFVSTQSGFTKLPGNQGVGVVAIPSLLLTLGAISAASGELELQAGVPPLPPGIDGMRLLLQAFAHVGAGPPTLEGASSFLWIDDALQ